MALHVMLPCCAISNPTVLVKPACKAQEIVRCPQQQQKDIKLRIGAHPLHQGKQGNSLDDCRERMTLWEALPGEQSWHSAPGNLNTDQKEGTVDTPPAMPCFAALYALLYGDATSACIEPVLMILPHFCSIMKGSAALVLWKAEDRHTAMMASHLSSGKVCTGETYWMPTLLTRMSRRPSSSWVCLIISLHAPDGDMMDLVQG